MKLLLSLLASTVCVVSAQSAYEQHAERANSLQKQFSGKVTNERLEAQWTADGSHLKYRRQNDEGKQEVVLVETATGKKAINPDAEILKPLDFPAPPKNKRRARSTADQDFPPPRPKSPDGRFELSIREHNLFIKDADGKETQLTTDGVDGHAYRNGGFWSVDSTRFVVIRVRDSEKRSVHMVDSSPKDQVQPKLFTHNYLKPGDRIAHPRIHLFDAESLKEIPVDDALFPNPWNVNRFHWSKDGQTFRFVYNQRGHQILRVIGVDRNTGEARAIIDEQSKTFIDYSQKQFVHFLNETDEILWSSERDGWHHLYLYDAKTGAVKNQITRGDWIVRKVEALDRKNRSLTFRAMGIHPNQDPYHEHFARVGFDGKGLVHLTEGDGMHTLQESPDKRHYIDTLSRVDHAPVHELRRTSDGTKVCDLEKADMAKLIEAGWQAPERFVAKGRDGKTDIHGIIIRPTHFDPAKKYPVIEKIYAGPHGHFVPKSFRSWHGAMKNAEYGFILVQIDGMGTNFRSKAFHDLCWQNIKDSGFPDRILWMKAAAAKYPSMDLDRVGIYGGSAGGQSTLAGMLFHPEFYKVGVSDCGCHDNRMDKIWWNEAWMGWPIGDHYADNSNVTHAGKLQGKLLLTVGELDKNVDPASTMQVVNALIKADKDFDMIVVPGAGHGIGESRYMDRRRTQFFIEHLLDASR